MYLEGQTEKFYFWPEVNGQEIEVLVETVVHMVERDVNCVTQKVTFAKVDSDTTVDFINNDFDLLAYGEWLMEQSGHRTTGEWHTQKDAQAFKEIK